MSVVWEDLPPTDGRSARFSELSPLRKEAMEIMDTLRQRPGAWARLWDFEDKDEAKKRVGYVSSVAQVKGAKSPFGFALRATPQGWSVFGRAKEQAPDPEPIVTDEVRESTF